MQNGIYRAAAYNQPAHIKNVIDQLIDIGKRTCVKNRNALVKKKFNAIKDERRKGLLNDIIKKKGWKRCGITIFNELIDVLKQASIEPREIAYMLLEVEDKSILILMINQILIQHEDEDYVPSIFLSIDNDRLKSMISDIKDHQASIARILDRVNEVSKLIRLFNIIELSQIVNEKKQIVLDMLVINSKIVNELIDKPEEELNEILTGIKNTKLVNKIECAIKTAQEARTKLIAAQELEKLRKIGIATIVIAVAVAVIEALFTRMSIKDALNNGHSLNDEAMINRMFMALVTVVMMLSMIVYVKCANKPVWSDRLMIGGSVVMALVRVLMCVYEGICGVVNMNMNVNVNEYVRMRLINVVMSLVMATASVVAVINSRNNSPKNNEADESSDGEDESIDEADKNESNDVSKNASGIAKSVIVVVSTFVMAMTGWVIQAMGVDVGVSSEMNNEILQ